MQTINLIDPKKSDVKVTTYTFPDGEPHLEIEGLNRKDEFEVITRITSSRDLFELMLLNDILTRQGVRWNLYITYLMTQRMDRVIDFNRPFSLKVMCDTLNAFSCSTIRIIEPHNSDVLWQLLNKAMSTNITNPINNINIHRVNYVLPDSGARNRYGSNFYSQVVFNKVRDWSTGKLLKFEIEEDRSNNSEWFFFIDDLVDGGGTFLGELEILKAKYPDKKFGISVIHAVSEYGIRKLCESFDKVIITNSYTDWAYLKNVFNNLEVIDICK